MLKKVIDKLKQARLNIVIDIVFIDLIEMQKDIDKANSCEAKYSNQSISVKRGILSINESKLYLYYIIFVAFKAKWNSYRYR